MIRKTNFLIFFSVLAVNIIIAQNNDLLQFKIDSVSRYFIFNENGQNISIDDFKSYIKNSLNQNIELKPRSKNIDPTNTEHAIYEQYYYNVVIEKALFFTRTRDNYLTTANGFIEKAINLPSPSGFLPFSSVVNQLISSLERDQYKWQDSTWENQIKTNNPDATYFPKEDVKVLKLNSNIFNDPNNYKYIYKIPISSISNKSDSMYTDSVYYVDATNGNLIRSEGMGGSNHPIHNNNPVVYKTVENTLKNKFCDSELNKNEVSASCNGNCQQNGVTLYFYGGKDIFTEHIKHNGFCSYRLHDNCTGTPLYVKETPNAAINDIWSTNSGWPQTADRRGTTALWSLRTTRDYYADVWGRYGYNQDSIVMLLIADNRIRSKTRLLSYYVANEKLAEATNVLYDIKAANNGSLDNFSKLQELIVSLKQTNDKIYSIKTDVQMRNAIEMIANDKTNFAYAHAQALLSKVLGYKYYEYVKLPNGTNGMRLKQNTDTEDFETVTKSMLIYPNPSNSNTNVICLLPAQFVTAELAVYDIMGKQLLKQPLSKDKPSSLLNTQDLGAGIYFINLLIDNNLTETQKFIKQ